MQMSRTLLPRFPKLFAALGAQGRRLLCCKLPLARNKLIEAPNLRMREHFTVGDSLHA